MVPKRSFVALALAFACASPLLAQDDDHDHDASTWEEPSLEEALTGAKAVVRAHADPATKPASPTIVVDEVICGEATKGASVVIANAHNVIAEKYLKLEPLAAGEEGIFILHEEPIGEDANKTRTVLPTPTFGRFPVKDGKVVGCPRDSFVRVSLKVEDYAALLKNAYAKAKGQKPDAAWLAAQRAALGKIDATSVEQVDAAHVALESVALGAEAGDAELALRFFASPRFQVRISAARLLERAGGERAADGLLRLATSDEDPAVRSTAIESILKVKPRPKEAAKELLAHLRDQSAQTIRVQNADDPRANEYAAPLGASFETLRELGSGGEATTVAIELLARDDADVVGAACLHLAQARETPPLAPIVEKMRPKSYPYQGINELISNTLNRLTGESLPADREAWQSWLANRK